MRRCGLRPDAVAGRIRLRPRVEVDDRTIIDLGSRRASPPRAAPYLAERYKSHGSGDLEFVELALALV